MTRTNMPCDLRFVPYDERFLRRSFVWFQDAEMRDLTNTPPVTKEKQLEWFSSLSTRKDYVVWGIQLGDEPVGACGLKKITGGSAEYWGYLGEKRLWGKRLGQQIVSFCLKQAKERGLRRVWLTVNANNARAIALYRKMGFVVIRQDPANIEMEVLFGGLGVDSCGMIDFPKIADPRGNLTFVEGGIHVPFDIKRVFYLYDVPGGADRGGHALKSCEQVLIAASGSFDVLLNDGSETKKVHLCRSYYGLYLTPLIWREMDNFSTGSVCLVLASERYDPDGYFRNYVDYVSAMKALRS